jgi:hypothetical protein
MYYPTTLILNGSMLTNKQFHSRLLLRDGFLLQSNVHVTMIIAYVFYDT